MSVEVLNKLKESQLLRRLKKKDDSAFVEAYDIYAPKIFRHALFRTSSEEVAQDIMSETFLRAWEYLRSGKKELTYLQAFLYRIANNLVVDHYRSRAKDPDRIDEHLERRLGQDSGIIETTDLRIEYERMLAALSLIKEDARDLLVMRYIDELTIEEISVRTDKKKNAVYVALHRAVKELKHVCETELTIR